MGALHSKLEDMSAHIAKLEVKNEKTMHDFRKTTNAFLSELISVVGSQFDRMQAQLLESQQLQIKVTSLASDVHTHTREDEPLPHLIRPGSIPVAGHDTGSTYLLIISCIDKYCILAALYMHHKSAAKTCWDSHTG